MPEAQAAAGQDRLPWLPDEPRPSRRPGSALPWALAATVLIAGGAYWVGMTVTNRADVPQASTVQPSQTIPLPQARPLAPQHVEPIEPVVAPPITIVEQPAPQPGRRLTAERAHEKPVHPVTEQALPEPKATEVAKPETEGVPSIWPVRSIEGASGRLIRIGTFTTVHQAKRGWWAIMKGNPTLKRLPALVVPVRSLRDGKTYYRLQMGTTSQAHSAVLCQRMRMIAQSCVVIGLDGSDVQVAL